MSFLVIGLAIIVIIGIICMVYSLCRDREDDDVAHVEGTRRP